MPDLQGSGLEHQVRPKDAEPRFIILRANRRKVVTVYRQDALRCADYLGRHGPAMARDTGVARARAMMSPITAAGSNARRAPPAEPAPATTRLGDFVEFGRAIEAVLAASRGPK